MRLQSTQKSKSAVCDFTMSTIYETQNRTIDSTQEHKEIILANYEYLLDPTGCGSRFTCGLQSKSNNVTNGAAGAKEPAGCSRCRPLLLVASLVPYHQSTCALSALYVPCRCCCDLTARTWLSCLRFGIHFLLLSLSLDERSYDRCESDQGLTTL